MKVTQHIAISTVVSGLFYLATRSTASAIACFAAGILLDVDHVVDYVLNHGVSIRIDHFFTTFKNDVLKYVVVFLHSWEFALISFVVLWRTGWNTVAMGIVIGAGVHLLLDNMFNGHSSFAYFLTYRLINGFSARRFYGEVEYKERMAAIEARRRSR